MTDRQGREIKVGDYVSIHGNHTYYTRTFKQGVVAKLDPYSNTPETVLVIGYNEGMPILIPARNSAVTILEKFELSSERKRLLDGVRKVYDDMALGIESI